MKTLIFSGMTVLVFLMACNQNGNEADAYGNFESVDQLVTAEIPGKILSIDIEEGQVLQQGDTIALIDTTQLHLKKKQLLASIDAIRGKLQDAEPQISLLKTQIEVLEKEKARVKALVSVEAATEKQLDDIQGKIDILYQQINTTTEQTKLANKSLLSQILPLRSQIDQIEDQIGRCFVINPVDGTVLLKLAHTGELANPAKPLYQVADVSTLYLRAYISGVQLTRVRLGQQVDVEIDYDKKENQQVNGEISWISDKAEFTPKTIQTKEERVNLVYAIKIKVDNSAGLLKIGMPGEVHFNQEITND